MALESAYQPFFTSWYSRPKRLWEVEATPEDDAISSAVSRFFCREQAKLQAQQSEELSKLTSSKRKQSDDGSLFLVFLFVNYGLMLWKIPRMLR